MTSPSPGNRRVRTNGVARITLGIEQWAQAWVGEWKTKHIVDVDATVLVAVIDEDDVDKLLEL